MNQRQQLVKLLGKNEPVTVTGSVIEKKDCSDYFFESLQLSLNTLETVPAFFAYPKGAQHAPLVLFNHSHGGNFVMGKTELVHSSEYLQQPSFLAELLGMGYAVAAIDHFGFGSRQGKKESELVKEFLLTGRTLWGMRLFDSQHALDYLLTRDEVDDTRVATIGMSMGGFMSWWLAAIDERVKVCVDIASQASFESLIAERGLDHHGFYLYVPQLLEYFKTSDIQALIAPRAHLSLVGKNDNMCPNSGVEQMRTAVTATYQKQEAGAHYASYSLTGGHQET